MVDEILEANCSRRKAGRCHSAFARTRRRGARGHRRSGQHQRAGHVDKAFEWAWAPPKWPAAGARRELRLLRRGSTCSGVAAPGLDPRKCWTDPEAAWRAGAISTNASVDTSSPARPDREQLTAARLLTPPGDGALLTEGFIGGQDAREAVGLAAGTRAPRALPNAGELSRADLAQDRQTRPARGAQLERAAGRRRDGAGADRGSQGRWRGVDDAASMPGPGREAEARDFVSSQTRRPCGSTRSTAGETRVLASCDAAGRARLAGRAAQVVAMLCSWEATVVVGAATGVPACSARIALARSGRRGATFLPVIAARWGPPGAHDEAPNHSAGTRDDRRAPPGRAQDQRGSCRVVPRWAPRRRRRCRLAGARTRCPGVSATPSDHRPRAPRGRGAGAALPRRIRATFSRGSTISGTPSRRGVE